MLNYKPIKTAKIFAIKDRNYKETIVLPHSKFKFETLKLNVYK